MTEHVNREQLAQMLKRSRANKFGAQSVVIDGERFDSRWEGERWNQLRLAARAGLITDLRRQVSYELAVNGVKVCSYRADFVYRDETGKEVVEDAKGHRTREYLIKKALMRAIHGIEIFETIKERKNVKRNRVSSKK
jgi:hypothetical protein